MSSPRFVVRGGSLRVHATPSAYEIVDSQNTIWADVWDKRLARVLAAAPGIVEDLALERCGATTVILKGKLLTCRERNVKPLCLSCRARAALDVAGLEAG